MTERETIITKLKETLQGIKKTNGYNTDVGKSVHVWRIIPFNPNELPAISIADLEANVYELSSAWDVRLEVAIDIVSSSIDSLRLIIDDVKRSLGSNETLNGYATSITYLGDQIEVDTQETRICAAHMKIAILYRTPRWVE